MSRVPVKIVIDLAHQQSQAEVCRAVSAAGMSIEQVIPEIGAIFGSADEGVMDSLGRVEGVLRAQREGGYRQPPLDPGIPQ